MKCKTCNGLGRTKATEFVGVDEGLRDVVILCPTCGGKGEVEMTEQEYIQTCNTEQLARWIVKIVDCDYCPVKQTKCKNNVPCIAQIEKWLKQPHTEKE